MGKTIKIRPLHIFLFFVSFYLLTFSYGGFHSYFYSIDGKTEYDQTGDIVRGDLSLLLSPRKHLGLSLTQIPVYIAGEFLGKLFHLAINPPFTLALNIPITAFSAVIFFLILRLWTTPGTALLITLIYGLATPAWSYAKSDTTDPLVTLTVLTTCWALFNYRQKHTRQWFLLALLCTASVYITKLVGHVFIFAWAFYLLLVEKQYRSSPKSIALKLLAMIGVWAAVLPISLSINKASASCYTWNWFTEFGHKVLVREFSPFDGLFIYGTVVVFSVFSARHFLRDHKRELFMIAGMVLPYALILHMGVEYFCLYDFGGRYDTLITPLLLLLLYPFLERFDPQRLPVKTLFILSVFWGIYVQVLANSVSILDYANMIGGSLGAENWRSYVFAWKYSPFGVYPKLISQFMTGIAIPPGLSNISASIVPRAGLDYIWLRMPGPANIILPSALTVVCCYYLYRFARHVEFLRQVERYKKPLALTAAAFILALAPLFRPDVYWRFSKETPVDVGLPTSPAELASDATIPAGWTLLDWSAQNGAPSVVCPPSPAGGCSASGISFLTSQDYVTISLASPAIAVEPGQVIRGYATITEGAPGMASLRIEFADAKQRPIYYAPTTRSRAGDRSDRKVMSAAIVPPHAVTAHLFLNIWGTSGKGKSISFDDIVVTKQT